MSNRSKGFSVDEFESSSVKLSSWCCSSSSCSPLSDSPSPSPFMLPSPVEPIRLERKESGVMTEEVKEERVPIALHESGAESVGLVVVPGVGERLESEEEQDEEQEEQEEEEIEEDVEGVEEEQEEEIELTFAFFLRGRTILFSFG